MANLLPRDVLLSFLLECSTSFEPRQALQTLYRRQGFLRTTRLDSGVLSADALLNGSARLQNITLLQLQVHGLIATEYGHDLIKALPALLHLEIRVDLVQYCEATGHNHHLAPHRIDASEEILTKIFRHSEDDFIDLWNDKKLQGCAKGKLKLRSLSLHGLDLGKPEPLLQAVKFSRLHSLVVQECANIVELLRGVRPTGLPSRMNMTDLVLTENPKWTRNDRNEDDDAIDDFLKSFHGLQHMVVYGPEEDDLRPSSEAMTAHADTLRSLFLFCKFPEESDGHYEPAELRAFLERCSQLEQLAVQVPPLYPEFEVETIRRADGAFMVSCDQLLYLHVLHQLDRQAQQPLSPGNPSELLVVPSRKRSTDV
ncbi:hypothetical protein LTR56_006894 [Elasticomyces elasticus]|nr:hypothetical protein LTR22_016579 [Elasticomyces elasticus]KAK3649418.1 hypothetical protein LTR56_006894 [Elasticomyces elasticus]KAK4928049.1 hypothetical protein LTR49_005248 [Elasticomyces elasticus]KAK5753368.1 hypothetical protein LTS12_016515 [Elasticomyces elasticus]